ncbi:MAG: NAD-dependent epimerase/dehydratase family protein [Polyangiales bacterium]|nr:NAD-dependent epimerase/dehydratase family protein [Myxococcales bacterium]MCB9659175.1 NAD-dependent epimerase/dehydratase family protein [Sandaracinaceae bacterium]
MKTLLVTGAKGTVGSYVTGLAEASGYRVIATDMSRAGVRSPVRGEVRVADLRDPSALDALVKGCDAVIHTAAQLDAGADSAELSRTNTDAVASLYEAATRAGAKRFIQVSNATLYASRGATSLDEESEIAPRGPFGMSKRAAETFLLGQHGDGPSVTVLRAAPIYGRRGRHFAASLLAVGPLVRLASPVVPRFGGGPMGTMVHAEDVARAALHLLPREDAAGQVYNVSDGDEMTLGARLGITFDAYGLTTVSLGDAPEALYRFLGKLFQQPGAHQGADVAALAAWKAVVMRHGIKPALRPRLDVEHMTLLYEDLVVDGAKLAATGFTPRHASFETGWRDVLRWYQAEEWVPRYG